MIGSDHPLDSLKTHNLLAKPIFAGCGANANVAAFLAPMADVRFCTSGRAACGTLPPVARRGLHTLSSDRARWWHPCTSGPPSRPLSTLLARDAAAAPHRYQPALSAVGPRAAVDCPSRAGPPALHPPQHAQRRVAHHRLARPEMRRVVLPLGVGSSPSAAKTGSSGRGSVSRGCFERRAGALTCNYRPQNYIGVPFAKQTS